MQPCRRSRSSPTSRARRSMPPCVQRVAAGEQRVVHLPELALLAGAVGGFRRRARRGMKLQRQVAHDEAQLAGVDEVLLQQRPGLALEAPAVRALVVGELQQRQRGVAACRGCTRAHRGSGARTAGHPPPAAGRRTTACTCRGRGRAAAAARLAAGRGALIRRPRSPGCRARCCSVPVSCVTLLKCCARRYSAMPSLTLLAHQRVVEERRADADRGGAGDEELERIAGRS